uniref:Endonuclease/exonuclease/phosphatase domain-containing protein n=1 Tax=Davidia involucrata TaxID=16924 RepID=A0A5B7C6S5_DAVIN
MVFMIMLLNSLYLRQMCKAQSKRLLIGNIHVLYNPSRGDVKLGQIRSLLSRAHMLSEKWGNVPVVLTGDYNMTPQSAIYEFLSSSELNIMLHDRREISGQRSCHPAQVFGVKREMGNPLVKMDRFLKCCWTVEEVTAVTGNPECQVVVHPLKLNSSYPRVKGSTGTRGPNGEPLATSYHSKFLGTVDYLWYSDGIVPTRVLDTLPIDVLWKTGGLPCKKLGSDHLALVSEFSFMQGTKEDNIESNNMTTSTTISAIATILPEEDDNSLL